MRFYGIAARGPCDQASVTRLRLYLSGKGSAWLSSVSIFENWGTVNILNCSSQTVDELNSFHGLRGER